MALALVLPACGPERDLEAWMLAGMESSAVVGSESPFLLEYVRTLGPDVLPMSFTYLGPAGVSSSGSVALRSHKDCKIAVLNAASGDLERYFGRCGSGPHESRTIAALDWLGDTLVLVDAGLGRIRLFGPADTVVRSIQLGMLRDGGTRAIHTFQIMDDSTAILSLVRLPAEAALSDQHGVLMELDLRTGAFRRFIFEEPAPRREISPSDSRYYAACAHRGGEVAIIENNGPAEIVAVGLGGVVQWARRVEVEGVRFGEGLQNTASSHWNRFPVKPACGRAAVVSRLMQETGKTLVGQHLGRIVVLDWQGTTLMNLPIEPKDSLLAYAGWYAGDSLFYVTTTAATLPRTLVFRLRARMPGEEGAFAIPPVVRDSIVAEPTLVTP